MEKTQPSHSIAAKSSVWTTEPVILPIRPYRQNDQSLGNVCNCYILALARPFCNTRLNWDLRPLVGLCLRLQPMDPIGYKKPLGGSAETIN